MITSAAYDANAEAWLHGPDAVFDVLSGELVQGLSGLVVDVGCGTGTASLRLRDSGARVIAVDSSFGMLRIARDRVGCSAVAGDCLALPLRDGSADGVVLGFVLNHLDEPWHALAEARRVVRPRGRIVASTWARDDPRLVQGAMEDVLVRHGWQPPEWYADFKGASVRHSDTVELLDAAAARAGLVDVTVSSRAVSLPLPASSLLSWRLGLPHTAPWFEELGAATRASVMTEGQAAIAALPDVFVQVLVLSGTA